MSLLEGLALAVTAIFAENFIFSKFLGCCSFFGVSKKTDTSIGMGFALIFVMTIASAAAWLVDTWILIPFELEYMRTLTFVLLIAGIVQFTEMFLQKRFPALYYALGIYLPLITTNCAVLGVAFLNSEKQVSFIHAISYAFFSAIGLALAILIFAVVRERLDYAECPKAFSGFPLSLITAALVTLAFMGLQGICF